MDEVTTWVEMGGKGDTGETIMLGLGAAIVKVGTGGGSGKKKGGGAMMCPGTGGSCTGDRRPGGGTGTVTVTAGGCWTSRGAGGEDGLLWGFWSIPLPDTV